MEWKRVYEKIIRMAHTAPSGDNLHPWFFEVSRGGIDVFFVDKDDEDRILFRIDPIFPGDAIAFGALAENLRIAATEWNIDFHITAGQSGDRMFTVTESGKRVSEDPLVPFLRRRGTDRRPYSREVLDREIYEEISRITHSFGGEVLWLKEEDEKNVFARLAGSFERILWNNPILRRHVGGAFRFRKDEHEGVHPEHMGLGWKKFFFPFFFTLVRKIPALYVLMGIVSGQNSQNLIRHSAAVGFLVMKKPFSVRKTYIDGGRAFERLWLFLTKNGVALQPLYGMAGVGINHLLKVGKFSPLEREWQRAALSNIDMLFPESKGKTPIIFFRIGYPTGEALPATPRKHPHIIWK